jgi:cell division protein FtsZ
MAAKSISEIITIPGYINVDFADVKYVMSKGGAAIMGTATAEGDRRALKAAQGALNSPLLNDNDIRGAKRILVNITSGPDEQVTIDEITEINEYIQEVAKDTDIIFGTCDDSTMGSKLSVTVIATGFEATYKPAFLTPVNKVVRDLNEDIKEKQVVAAPQTETRKEVVQPTLLLLDEEAPVQKVEKLEPLVAATTVVESKPQINIEEEEPYSLFSLIEPAKEEVASENVVVFEFETSQEEHLEEELVEDMAATEIQQEETLIEQPIEVIQEELTTADNIESATGQEKEEESFVVFNVKSYEASQSEEISKGSLEQQLNDRKRILSQLSYRSLNKGNMSELETTPAYMRKGVEVQNTMHSNTSELSRFSIGEDPLNQRPEVKKNNSFLHDNVD